MAESEQEVGSPRIVLVAQTIGALLSTPAGFISTDVADEILSG